MKMETIRSLQDSLDSLKKQSGADSEKAAKDISTLKDILKRKEESIKVLSDQCEELVQGLSI